MNRGKITAIIVSFGIVIGGATSVNHNNSTNKVLLVNHLSTASITQDKTPVALQKINSNQQENSGLQLAYIGGTPTGAMSFAAIPPSSQKQAPLTFASPLQKQLYEYLSKPVNQKTTMDTAIDLHDGDSSNTCVLFQSSALRANGVEIPKSTAYTTVLMGNLLRDGWTRHTDFENLQPGDICFASTYHTFMFMGWYNKEQRIAYVMGNEAYKDSTNYGHRHLNGKIDKELGQYKATSYYTYSGKPSKTPILSGKILAGDASLKTMASDEGSVIGSVNYGDKVAILDQEGSYYKINDNGTIGWINATDILPNGIIKNYSMSTSDSGNTNTNNNTKFVGLANVNSNSGLWLNGNPSLSNPQNIVVMPANSQLKVIKQQGSWTKVSYNGQIGWAYTQYLNVSLSNSSTNTNINDNQIISELKGTATATTDVYLNDSPKATFDGAKVITTLHNGDKIQIIGKSLNGWYEAIFNGKKGYVMPKYTRDFVANAKEDNIKPTPAPSIKPSNKVIKVTSDIGLWLLEKPFEGHILVMPDNATMTVLSQDGNWTKVNYNGQLGWCYTEYTTRANSDSNTTSSSEQGNIIANGGLWLLGEPDVSARHIQVMPQNSNITILEKQGDWSKVIYNGITGWCYNKYIS